MRSLRSSLVTFALSSLVGSAIVAGCSADGTSGDPLDGTDFGTDTSTTDPEDEGGSNILPDDGDDDPSDGTKDAGSKKDSSTKDSGSKKDSGKDDDDDAAVDAATSPNPGDPCVGAATFSRACGNCGKQTAFCTAAGDGGAGGVVGPYGTCDEPDNACAPGTIVEEACGDCGTIKKTCSNKCQFPTSGTCAGQPANHCSPGKVQWSAGQCAPGLYISSSCGDDCKWSGWSAGCSVATTPNKMTISDKIGNNNVVSAPWKLDGSTKRPSSVSSCTGTTTTASGPFVYVEIANNTAKKATVTLYATASPTNVAITNGVIDTVMWTYAGTGIPMVDADIAACTKAVDQCTAKLESNGATAGNSSTNICGGSGFYNFSSIEGVTLNAGEKALVLVSTYTTATKVGDGTFVLNLRTDKLE